MPLLLRVVPSGRCSKWMIRISKKHRNFEIVCGLVSRYPVKALKTPGYVFCGPVLTGLLLLGDNAQYSLLYQLGVPGRRLFCIPIRLLC